MSDPDSPDITYRSGGVDIGGNANIGGDVVGRDKISITITEARQYDVHGLANPYLGLQSFTYDDHAKYAGRDKLISETVARLTSPDDPLALLFITGASGSGKSSFVQAGLLPALEKHYAALGVEWAVFRPSRDPLAALADALWRQLGLPLPQFDARAASPDEFGDFLRSNTPRQQVNVIVIDQFEELFTQSAAQPRDALFNLLANLLSFRSTRTHIIATVRADYLPELFALPALYDIAKRGIDLRVMSVDELREAIQQPLRATYVYPDRSKHFQAELVERLAKDAAEDAAYLPLLQVTLEEIWRRGTLTLGSYTNLTDAIKQRADKVLAYKDYDAAQPNQARTLGEQVAILNLCLDLVDVSLDDEARRDVRRRRLKYDLVSVAPERAQLIDTLTQARLLSVEAEPSGPPHIEVDIIHETLLSNWDRLRQAIAERRHELRQRAHFEQQLQEWVAQNQSDDYLLSGVRLAEARELVRRNDIALRSTHAHEFARRSIVREIKDRQQAEEKLVSAAEQAARRLRRRNRIIIIVSGLALLAAVGAIFLGVNGYKQQRLSRSRELAMVAISQLDINPERSILVALEANTAAHTVEAEDALWRALGASQIATLHGHEGPVNSAQFSPDGLRVVTASDDRTARVWEAETGKEVAVLRGHVGRVSSAQFSSDGKEIVTASRDGTARVWEAATGQEVAVMRVRDSSVSIEEFTRGRVITIGGNGTIQMWDAVTGEEVGVLGRYAGSGSGAQSSPDLKWAVTTGPDGTAHVWNARTAKEVATLRGHDGPVLSAEFSPDGQRIVTTGQDGTVREWETATWKLAAVLRGHEGPVNDAQYSPDGKKIVTAGKDGTARIYPVLIEDLMALAKTRVTRELTCAEWVQYLHEDIVCETAPAMPSPVPYETIPPTPTLTPTPRWWLPTSTFPTISPRILTAGARLLTPFPTIISPRLLTPIPTLRMWP